MTAGVAEGSQDEHLIQHWTHEALILQSLGAAGPHRIVGIPMQEITLEVM
jgi:lipopolysaccharide transport system ATP-binding protein